MQVFRIGDTKLMEMIYESSWHKGNYSVHTTPIDILIPVVLKYHIRLRSCRLQQKSVKS